MLLYTDSDLQRKDLPIGFSFELWRYMVMDTIIHPVMHLLYYLIKTKNYKLFFKLCKKYNEIFYCYAKGNIEVYSFYEYIEGSKKFIENIKKAYYSVLLCHPRYTRMEDTRMLFW